MINPANKRTILKLAEMRHVTIFGKCVCRTIWLLQYKLNHNQELTTGDIINLAYLRTRYIVKKQKFYHDKFMTYER